MRWKTSLHSSQCREIQPSLESGHLSIHSNWGRKLRVPLNYILLREGSSCGAFGKLAYLCNRVLGISSLLEMIWGARSIPWVAVWDWCSSRLEMGVSGNLWSFLKEVKWLALYDVEHRMAIEPMCGKWASSRDDLGHPELFCIPVVTSVLSSSWDSVLGDCLEFHEANRGSFRVWLRTRCCSECNARESGFISRRGGSLMGFLELLQEPGVYYRVMAGMAIWNLSLFSEVRTPV